MVNGDLIIGFNDNLANISGLESLRFITGDVVVRGNPALEDVCAVFGNLMEVGGTVDVAVQGEGGKTMTFTDSDSLIGCSGTSPWINTTPEPTVTTSTPGN